MENRVLYCKKGFSYPEEELRSPATPASNLDEEKWVNSVGPFLGKGALVKTFKLAYGVVGVVSLLIGSLIVFAMYTWIGAHPIGCLGAEIGLIVALGLALSPLRHICVIEAIPGGIHVNLGHQEVDVTYRDIVGVDEGPLYLATLPFPIPEENGIHYWGTRWRGLEALLTFPPGMFLPRTVSLVGLVRIRLATPLSNGIRVVYGILPCRPGLFSFTMVRWLGIRAMRNYLMSRCIQENLQEVRHLISEGQYEFAHDPLDRILQIEPDLNIARALHCFLLTRDPENEGNVRLARTILDDIIGLEKNLYLRGAAFAVWKDTEEAFNHLRNAIRKDKSLVERARADILYSRVRDFEPIRKLLAAKNPQPSEKKEAS